MFQEPAGFPKFSWRSPYNDPVSDPFTKRITGNIIPRTAVHRLEFCLITAFQFGHEVRPPVNRYIAIRDRLFSNIPAHQDVKVGHFLKLFDRLDSLSDLDAVRVCLQLALEKVFLGRQHDFTVHNWCLFLLDDLDA